MKQYFSVCPECGGWICVCSDKRDKDVEFELLAYDIYTGQAAWEGLQTGVLYFTDGEYFGRAVQCLPWPKLLYT